MDIINRLIKYIKYLIKVKTLIKIKFDINTKIKYIFE